MQLKTAVDSTRRSDKHEVCHDSLAQRLLLAAVMIISALVITLSDTDPEVGLATLQADHRLELGDASGCRVPVVAETSDDRASEDLVRELAQSQGIEAVDVIMIDFSLAGYSHQMQAGEVSL